ncbi:MAG: hypothetical protein L6R41_007010 [Letrouitia leprolyta]|nr:MAG: hypothetical protein L6R41_007010 [Letrouitia leprolyta]
MSSTAAKSTQQAHPNTDHRERRDTGSSHGTNTSTFSYDSIVPDSSHGLDGQGLGLGMNLDAIDTSHTDLFWPSMSNYPPLDFDDGLFSNMDSGPFSLPTPVSDSHNTTPRKQSYAEENRYSDNASFQPPSNGSHDCFREAYDVLGSLSLHRFPIPLSTPQSPVPNSASTSTNAANRVPLDHVLRLNREAIERLGSLLSCPCAGSPQLTILYASIISQILVWYQQAAGCTQIASTCAKSASWNPNAETRSDSNTVPLSLTASSPSSTSGSVSGPSPWSSTAASTLSTTTGGGKNTPTLPMSQQFPNSVAPAKMAIGTFDIDDTRVQTALKIQLLSGEMRRAGRLIEQFAGRNMEGQCVTGDHARFGGVHSLYRSLDAWLRCEHARIAERMKSRLGELNG